MSPHEWDQCPYKRDLMELSCIFWYVTTQKEDGPLWTKKRTFTKQQMCWWLYLGHSSLQNGEKQISVVFKPPSLWYFSTAPQMDRDNLLCHQHKTGILSATHKIHEVALTKDAVCLDMWVQPNTCPVTSHLIKLNWSKTLRVGSRVGLEHCFHSPLFPIPPDFSAFT